MSDGTKIEWSDSTWNVVTGCDRVSPGCDHCYIERTPPFRMEGRKFDEHGKMGVRLHPDRLDKPLRWRKPRRVFVNSLSDLFHPDVPDEFIAQVFTIMRRAERHTFQVLTKRPQRMAKLLSRLAWSSAVHDLGEVGWQAYFTDNAAGSYVLPNVWLGVSVENQTYANLRIPYLLATPAAVQFVSCEPLLGPVDLRPRPEGQRDRCIVCGCGPDASHDHHDGYRTRGIDWVIVGGESGPGARPMHPDWARGLRDQCVAAGVPFFFKQHGEFAPDHVYLRAGTGPGPARVEFSDGQLMLRVGKKLAGRLLDGREWNEYPDRQVI